MKKLLFVIIIAAISASAAKGQNDSLMKIQNDSPSIKGQYGTGENEKIYRNPGTKESNISIAINPSLPIGHFKTYSGFGLGGYLGWEGRLSKNFGLTLNAGYIDYFGKTADTIQYSDFNYIPVLGGAKYYMSGGFYIHGEAG